jgi:subtilisin family serine protease
LKLVAPGVDVLSSDRFEVHRLRSGTSMSAPHVAAAAAIWAEKHQERGADLLDLLLQNARFIPGRRDDVGVGLVTV